MQDRVSLYPGRVKLEPVAGQANTYDLTRADQPTQEGTPLNKETLLTDQTETELFGSAADRTVDDAFAGIAGQLKLIMSNMAAITLTVQDTTGKPIPEVLVQGILSESGQAVYTNANGVAAGYIGEGSQVIKVSGYADLVDYSETVTVVKGTTISKTIKLTTRNFLKITASKTVKFSGNVNRVDVTVVGGGGGGSGGSKERNEHACGGSGGGGGYCTVSENVSFAVNQIYPATVGAGGQKGLAYVASGSTIESTSGKDGGATSFLGVTALGGKGGIFGGSNGDKRSTGGAGNGKGGDSGRIGGAYNNSVAYGLPGVAGTVPGYSSFTEMVIYGGGGGGAGIRDAKPGGSGAGYGGNGGASNNIPATAGENGFGGGGGGGVGGSATGYDGAAGGSGCVAIRMHLKSAA